MEKKVSRKKSQEIGISGLNSISNLEAGIMKVVWEKEKATVREVHELMLRKEMGEKQNGFIPYTTVMSTMNTLADKGLLEQDKSAKTYIYSPAVTKTQLAKSIFQSVADKILDGTNQLTTVNKFLKNMK
ncbi:MAG: BlaI/MecI/CopY family transcriptional regulator [Actinomycetota bacterium]|nr:BlaI/MecI/CopY family transcriptional regulator [Actinomycetota bacterium]